MSLIAQKLKVPASTVSIHSGATSSLKKVLVTGISKKKLLAFLQRVEEDG
jgi:uncharacterized protein YggU (UPF0235/DUF167 family)